MGAATESRVPSWLAIVVVIGVLGAAAQTARAQVPLGPKALEIPDRRVGPIRDRFERLLLDDRQEDGVPGWRLAQDLGPAAGPLLWSMLAQANAPRDRMLLLAAYSAAMGPKGDERVLGFAVQGKNPREKAFAYLLVALGPRRDAPAPRGGRWIQAGDADAVRVAALLARSRFDGGLEVEPAGWREEPGVLAAALYAGAGVPPDLERWQVWRDVSGSAELVWRGYLLAANPADSASGDRLRRAQEVYARRSDPLAEARRCAASWLSRAPQRGAVEQFLAEQEVEVDLGLVLGLDATTRRGMVLHARRRPWFLPKPDPLLPTDSQRARSSTLYALHETLERLEAVSPQWGSLRAEDRAVAEAAALALAWRLLHDGSRDREWSGLPPGLEGIAESAWIAWALDVPIPEGAAQRLGDPQLSRAFGLAREGRLPVETASEILEAALWRRGYHPMLTLRELHRRLVRDLLLSGSRLLGGGYLPRGIEPSDTSYFKIADDFYRFTQDPGLRPPPEWRLARMLDRD